MREAFAEILADWRCTLIEFGGEADPVHLLVGSHPALNLSTLINNLKSASSRRMRNRFADHLAKFYWKPYFWHRAYYVGSVGGSSLETVKRYEEAQGTHEKPRKVARRPPRFPPYLHSMPASQCVHRRVPTLVAIASGDVSTLRTGLRGIAGIHGHRAGVRGRLYIRASAALA